MLNVSICMGNRGKSIRMKRVKSLGFNLPEHAGSSETSDFENTCEYACEPVVLLNPFIGPGNQKV